jgi:hypothetical protein
MQYSTDGMQLRSWLPCDDIASGAAAPNYSERAENQARAGNSHPKVKDPRGQTE